MATQGKTLGIYVHVPFCRSKCEYCDFYSLSGGRNAGAMDRYLRAVTAHIRETAELAPQHEVDTIYFGGGTPSFFGADGLIRILDEIVRRFHMAKTPEITFEANPDSAPFASLGRLSRAGFTRVSIGVQSDSDEMLRKLARPHDWKQAVAAVENARRAGFDNVSVDLMYGLPGQTREQWQTTLENVLALAPDHMSCYGLKVEEGTRLWDYREFANLPDDDAQADMYLAAESTLRRAGLHQYEISNFAKRGMECRHNLKYWLGGEYLGFGPTAASDFGGRRFTIARDLEGYINGVQTGGVVLSENEAIPVRERAGEYVMLRLRTTYGVEREEYQKTFLLPFAPLEKLLQKYEREEMAEQTAHGRWRLTPKGFLVSNAILLELLDEQQHSTPLAKKR